MPASKPKPRCRKVGKPPEGMQIVVRLPPDLTHFVTTFKVACRQRKVQASTSDVVRMALRELRQSWRADKSAERATGLMVES